MKERGLFSLMHIFVGLILVIDVFICFSCSSQFKSHVSICVTIYQISIYLNIYYSLLMLINCNETSSLRAIKNNLCYENVQAFCDGRFSRTV